MISSPPKNEDQKQIFLVAGEESANQYALRLMDEFKDQKNFTFSGIGYQNLKKKDFKVVFDAANLSVMGGVEILRKIFTVKKAFSLSVEYILKEKIKTVVLIDFGGFNLRLAKKIKEVSPETKILYFISPKFWAWGESRVKKVKKYVDRMYVIHPFEVDFYEKHSYSVSFVGHPLTQELKSEHFDRVWINGQKAKLKIPPDKKVICVMFGSRKNEIEKHKSPFLETLKLLKVKHPGLQVLCIVPPSKTVNDYEFILGASFQSPDFHIHKADDPMDLIALSDLALVASGTATLQVGLLGKPMAVGYIMNPLTMWLAKKFVKGVKFAGLINILSEKEVSKEFLQNDFHPKIVSDYLSHLLSEQKAYDFQKDNLLELKNKLGELNPYKELKSEIIKYT